MQTRAQDIEAVRAALAVLGSDGDDVPVGAVVLDARGTLLGTGHNERTVRSDPTAHAEVLALRQAAAALGTWRLEGCTLAVTLEPCPMCAGAAGAARISRLVFGAWNPDYGAAGSAFDVVRDRRLPHRIEVVGGVMEEECRDVLEAFFAGRRA